MDKIRKRDGRLVDFNSTKIYEAVLKAAATVEGMTDEKKDMIAESVRKRAVRKLNEKHSEGGHPDVEEIQDLVIQLLVNARETKVAEAYIRYRDERTKQRNAKSRLMKSIQEITFASSKDSNLKRDNGNINGDTPMGMMLQYGSTVAKQFADDYLIRPDIAQHIKEGDIYVHDKDFLPSGTLTCCQIPLDRLFKNGFDTGHGYLREPQSIRSYASLAAIAIQSNQNDQHGGQSIPLFDFYMAPGITKSYIKNIRKRLDTLLEFVGKDIDVKKDVMEHLVKKDEEVFKLRNKEKLKKELRKQLSRVAVFDILQLSDICNKAVEGAIKDTEKDTYQAMEALVHNLNTMHCLPFSEKIWVYDSKEQQLMLLEIGDFASIYESNRYYAISLNKETFKSELKLITGIQKKDNHRRLVKLSTKAGQSVTTTDNHEILSLDKDYENIVDILPENIREVLSPRGFTYSKVRNDINIEKYGSTYKTSRYLDNHVVVTEDFAELLGYYVADGSIVGQSVMVLTTASKLDFNYLIDLVKKVFGTDFAHTIIYYDGNKPKEIRFTVGVRIANMLKDICGSSSQTKKIPTEIMFADKDIILSFLNAYIKCDAAHKDYYAEISCSSEELVSQIQLLCLNFGEFITISTREYECAFDTTKTAKMYNLIIGGRACKRIGIELNRYPDIEYPKYDLSYLRDKVENNAKRRKSGAIRYDELTEETKYDNLFTVEVTNKQILNSKDEYVYDISVEDNENFLTKDCIFVHNSRAGAQVPFSSINFGMDTSEEGRMVSRNLLLAQQAGLGDGETPIFPILIFQVKEGVNYNPGDPNYDLFKLSIQVSAERLFPNFVFVDAPFNLKYYKPEDPETIISTMGCVDGNEVVTYKIDDKLYVESFVEMWNRLVKPEDVKHQGLSEYIETSNITIYDSHSNGFVQCKKLLRNPDMNNWCKITFSDGRQLYATEDHPLPVVGKGRTFVSDMAVGDVVTGIYSQYAEETVEMEKSKALKLGMMADERIPEDIFNWTIEARLAYLAGMMKIAEYEEVGESTIYGNKFEDMSLALKHMLLIQSLYIEAEFSEDDDRYKIEFVTGDADDLLTNAYNIGYTNNEIEVYDIEYIGTRDRMSYDVETESDYFDVSGISSHNCRTRVIGNVNGKESPVGRGNLSFTTINLPRLGIKHGYLYRQEHKNEELAQSWDKEGFYQELDEWIELCIEQLLERYEIQKHRFVKNFPFLMGQGVWRGSEELSPNEELGDVINSGTLSVGFIGLAECLYGLIEEHHGESEEAQKLGLEIIGHMRQRMDEAVDKYHLNFSLLATPAEGLSGFFTNRDKKKYGELEGITDKEYYTNSFHIPVSYEIDFYDKINLEAPYHEFTNAGHITYVEVDGDLSKNPDAFEMIIRCMKEAGIGYGSVNHPLDRDPLCGYSGIIEGNICPNCGRDISKNIVQKEVIKRL